MKNNIIEPIWKKEPEEDDYPAALDYLELLFSNKKAKKIVEKLKKAKMFEKKAKDILRASNLPLLPKTNPNVKKHIEKHKNGGKLAPILLIRHKRKLIIADGYHRMCAVYYLSENWEIPCKLV
jgi:hypothetical protein